MSSQSNSTNVDIRRVDMSDPEMQLVIVELIDLYAREPMGGGTPLPAESKKVLGERISQFPGHEVFLATESGKPLGAAVCFTGFSTFQAKPLINIHDLTVIPEARGKGVGAALLKAVETRAREMGYAKLTLEVLDVNERARGLYQKMGFEEKSFAGKAMLFLSKQL